MKLIYNPRNLFTYYMEMYGLICKMGFFICTYRRRTPVYMSVSLVPVPTKHCEGECTA